MDTLAQWWRRYVGGGNINRTLEEVHAKYGKLEYLLPALYVLYCLVLMQLIIKSFGVIEGFRHSLVVVIKLFLVHIGLALVILLILSQFSDSSTAQLLEHFLKSQLPSGFIALTIPIGCMLLAFILGMFKKLFSKQQTHRG